MGKTSSASVNKYKKKTYQRIILDIRMDSKLNKAAIEEAAAAAGQSVTAYVLGAVRERMIDEYSKGLNDINILE